MEFASLGFLKREVRAVLRGDDPNTADDRLTSHINDAYRSHLTSEDWWWGETSTTFGATPAVATYDLPDDFRRIKQLSFSRYDLQPVSPLDLPYLQAGRGLPRYYAVRALHLEVAPTPNNTGTFTMTYAIAPEILAKDSDVTVVPVYASAVLYLLAAKNAAAADTTTEQYRLADLRYREEFRNLRRQEISAQEAPGQPRLSPTVRNPMKRPLPYDRYS